MEPQRGYRGGPRPMSFPPVHDDDDKPDAWGHVHAAITASAAGGAIRPGVMEHVWTTSRRLKAKLAMTVDSSGEVEVHRSEFWCDHMKGDQEHVDAYRPVP